MTLDTRIDGDPGSIRACVRWLRDRLAPGVDRCVADLRQARDQAGRGWHGDTSGALASRMDGAGMKADHLRVDIERVANSFDAYADDLGAAQAGMERARRIAAGAGLRLAGRTILEPGPAPPAARPPVGPASPEAVSAYHASLAALSDHQRKMRAYQAAAEEVVRARALLDAARAIGRNVWDDVRGRAPFLAADLVNGAVVGGLARAHTSILNKHSAALMAESTLAARRYLAAPGGSAQARALNAQAYRTFLEADAFARRAQTVGRRVGAKVPVVGLAITAAGIGYDIHQGKPPGKAIISGTGGALAAAGTGAVVGTMIGGPVGTVVGAGAGLVVGVVAGGALDWGYDQLPQGVRDSIEGGFAEVGHAVGDAGEALGDGARKVWHAIF